MESGKTLNEVLLDYANQNLPYKDISCLLEKTHGYVLSPNAIRKRLKVLGYPSKRGETIHSLEDVKQTIHVELERNPITVGYRHMTRLLRHNGIHVRRDTVMHLLKELDGEGVKFRHRRRIRRKVYCLWDQIIWHVDGYDKLKPFGFAVHGCIDGFSRRIMWLKVSYTNNDPKVTAFNFVECVNKIKACPVILQLDPGTENSILGALQCVFRQNDMDFYSGDRSVRIVKSAFNQRIEAWWSMFRRQIVQWWIDLFKQLELFGGFQKENVTDVYCLRYCFIPLLQQELNKVAQLWNAHYITKSRQAIMPGGRPIVLYTSPENFGAEECRIPVAQEDIEWAFIQCEYSSRSGSRTFDELAQRVFTNLRWSNAVNWNEALHQYFHIREMAENQATV